MCGAFFGVAPPDAAGTGAVALARLESCVSEETPAAAAFWAALGGGADRSAMIPMACMAVVRAGGHQPAGVAAIVLFFPRSQPPLCCWLVSPPRWREASLPVAVPVRSRFGLFLRLRSGRHVLW